jgi:alpha/beta superfamily hydrolase
VVRIPVGDAFTLEGVAALRPGAPGAVVCHPHPAFGGRLDTPLVVALGDALHAAGLSTVRFNFRGLGGSGGESTGGLTEPDDVAAVADWLRAAGAPRVALVGYSFGALMALGALARGLAAEAFVGIGFPTRIVGHHADRVAAVEHALARGVPTLFLSGDADSFSEIDPLRRWVEAGRAARLEVLAGRHHFFQGEAAAKLTERVTDFVLQALADGAAYP